MPAPISAVGFDLNAILTAAQSQANGTQKAYYTSQVAGYIGSDPDITIRVAGVLKYRAGITGSLTTSASGVELPTTFDEPPATNTADALTSDDAIVEIESTVTPGRKLLMPLALASAANPNKLAISAALDGTNAMRASVILLQPPAILDAQAPDPGGPVAGGVVASVERFIQQMTTQAPSTMGYFASADWAKQEANIQCPSVAALANMTSGGRGDIMTNNDGPDSIVTWHWAGIATGHSSTNNCLEVRSCEAWVLKDDFATGSWQRLWGPTTIGDGYLWNTVNTKQWVAAVDRSFISGAGVAAYNSILNANGIEAWQVGFNPVSARNAALMADCVAIHSRCLVRVRRITNSSIDNRAYARYRFCVGYDIMNSKQYNYSGSTDKGTFSRPQDGSYPGYAMDGGRNMWSLVPYNANDPDLWYSYGVTSLAPATWTAGLGPPWAAAAGVEDWKTEKPEAKVPWCMSHQQFRNKPVPMPT